MTIDAVFDALEDHNDKWLAGVRAEHPKDTPDPQYWLSVNSRPGIGLDTLALVARRPNAQLRPSTVQAIRDAGWTICPTPGSRTAHCDVFYGDGHSLPPVEASRGL